MTAEFESVLIRALNDAASDLNMVVAVPLVRTFLFDLARESLLHRDQEWFQRGLDPTNPEEVYTVLLRSFQLVLVGARERMDVYPSMTPLMSVVQTIHERWCDMFPLCR